MRLLFVRHGETMWNIQKKIQGSTDIELNENGIYQAEQLAKNLKEKNASISRIYTSKQKRAKKTAEIISGYINAECVELDGLEEMTLGLWEGKTWVDVSKEFPLEYQAWLNDQRYTRTPKGESYQDLLDRLIPALEKIIIKETEDILIVTHGAVIMTLLSCLNDTPFSQMVENYKIDNMTMIEVDSSIISNM